MPRRPPEASAGSRSDFVNPLEPKQEVGLRSPPDAHTECEAAPRSCEESRGRAAEMAKPERQPVLDLPTFDVRAWAVGRRHFRPEQDLPDRSDRRGPPTIRRGAGGKIRVP